MLWFTDTSTWHHHTLFPWQRPLTISGLRAKGLDIMRRRINGQWQYRELNEAEDRDLHEKIQCY